MESDSSPANIDANKKKVLRASGIAHITKTESEIMILFVSEGLTPRQIALRRKTGIRAVERMLQNLRNKGYPINFGSPDSIPLSTNEQRTTQRTLLGKDQQIKKNARIRLHGQEFNIKIIRPSGKYVRIIKERGNMGEYQGHTVRLYQFSIEIYAGENTSFYGETPQEAFSQSLSYWMKFFHYLENELGILLIKPRKMNMKQVNAHYAEIDNEIAKEAYLQHRKIEFYAEEDGKCWFKIDNSWQLHEMECIHPKTGKPDMEKVLKQVNDWREEDPQEQSRQDRQISQVAILLQQSIEAQNNFTKSINSMAMLIAAREGISPEDLLKPKKRKSKGSELDKREILEYAL